MLLLGYFPEDILRLFIPVKALSIGKCLVKYDSLTIGISNKKVHVSEAKQVSDDCFPIPGTCDTKYKTIGTIGTKWNLQGRSIIVNGKYFRFDAKLYKRTSQHQY